VTSWLLDRSICRRAAARYAAPLRLRCSLKLFMNMLAVVCSRYSKDGPLVLVCFVLVPSCAAAYIESNSTRSSRRLLLVALAKSNQLE
jgi:hypothetical protein